jgi:hypothetical protein
MRKLFSRRFLMALGAALLAGAAFATNYSLWINGRTGGGVAGNYADFTYWGPSSTAAGVNKKAVNWDGYSHVSDKNYLIRNALDCYCTGPNWCYVAVHSAGNLQIGYALALYGGTSRYKKNPAATAPAPTATARPRPAGTSSGWMSPPAPRAGVSWPTPATGRSASRWWPT